MAPGAEWWFSPAETTDFLILVPGNEMKSIVAFIHICLGTRLILLLQG
jgi:hypothetical protein